MTNYVTCDIDDDLGDQMFQIAITLQYAKYHNKSPIFFTSKDFSYYNLKTANFDEKQKYNFREIKIDDHTKVADLTKIEGNIQLIGNFQLFNNMIEFKEKLQEVFFYNEDIMYKTYDLYKQIKNNLDSEINDKYVTVHVNKESYDETYYSKAYDIVSNLINSKGIYEKKYVVVISDDIEWCRENFKLKNAEKTYFVEETNKYIQMVLMSFVTNNILSDCKTSWWGAFLSDHQEKTVIIPSKLPKSFVYTNWIIV
jgi:hypothetical protein